MPDSVVSVRMPESLLEELRKVSAEQHYMDLSESVRNLVRRKIAEYDVARMSANTPGNGVATQQLINGLRNIINQLENGVEQEH